MHRASVYSYIVVITGHGRVLYCVITVGVYFIVVITVGVYFIVAIIVGMYLVLL